MAAFVTPKTLGESFYRIVLGTFLLGVALWVLWAAVSGKFWQWRAEEAANRAAVAEQNARIAAANAASANQGAANATLTRNRTDELVIDVRGLGEVAAAKIEATAPPVTERDEPMDEAVIEELGEAEARIAAQARRLRGKR